MKKCEGWWFVDAKNKPRNYSDYEIDFLMLSVLQHLFRRGPGLTADYDAMKETGLKAVFKRDQPANQ